MVNPIVREMLQRLLSCMVKQEREPSAPVLPLLTLDDVYQVLREWQADPTPRTTGRAIDYVRAYLEVTQ